MALAAALASMVTSDQVRQYHRHAPEQGHRSSSAIVFVVPHPEVARAFGRASSPVDRWSLWLRVSQKTIELMILRSMSPISDASKSVGWLAPIHRTTQRRIWFAHGDLLDRIAQVTHFPRSVCAPSDRLGSHHQPRVLGDDLIALNLFHLMMTMNCSKARR